MTPLSRPSGRKPRRSSAGPLIASCLIGACAVAAITYLLWPTWALEQADDPERLPITIGNVLFNVPTKAIRVKLQKRTGMQERVDLAFAFPSLEPPQAPRHITAADVETEIQPIDRIFVSIFAHHDALSPEERLRNIYPRYLEQETMPAGDGLHLRAFRDGTPYSSEDLAWADTPRLVARCTRDAATPGMCRSERRIEVADVSFRFPREWLTQWRNVAGAMDRITSRLRESRP
jgi:hypothetical protein